MAGKTTVPCTKEQYTTLITTIFNGVGSAILPNPRIASMLEIEANTGLRISDICQLNLDSIIRDGNRWRFNLVEQKTKKLRTFTVPDAIYQFLLDFVDKYGTGNDGRIFPVTKRAVQKHLKKVCEYLGDGYENIGTHSFRKYFGREIYYANDCDIELVKKLLQHSSVAITSRYLGLSDAKVDAALQKHVSLISG